jgi:hypothetical protein
MVNMDTGSKEQNVFPVVRGGFVYNILKCEDVEEAVECLAVTFTEGSPTAIALGIKKNEFRFLAEIFCKKAAEDGLSLTAKECDTGKVIGTVIVEDFLAESPPYFDRISSKFEPTFALVGQLYDKYKKEHHIRPNELLHSFMIGVYQEYSGKKVGFNLQQVAHILGKKNRYEGVVTELISPAAQKNYYSLGYEFIDSVNYSEFEFKGKKVFAKITACEGCHLLYKKL